MIRAPRSLFGRNLLLIAVLVVIGQLGGVLLLRELVVRPRLDAIAGGVADNVVAVRDGLAALPPGQRAAFVDAFNRGAFEDGSATADRSAASALSVLERRFVRRVSTRLAQQGGEVVWRRSAGGPLAVRFVVDGADYWLSVPGGLPAREFSGSFVAAATAVGLLALIGAAVIQRRLNEPLANVVAAARALARGAPPAPLAETGPVETAALARSFNRLAASLARADRERALLLAGVSHDLRTPLAKLRLGVEIVVDKTEPELSASMARSIEEMDAIVGQFLDFARDDAAEPLQEAELDALARAVAAAAADHGRPITLEAGGAPRVRMRAQGLRRCVDNLVENAFRHGRPPVVVRTAGDAGWAWIEVCDAGDGIAEGDAEALKQPFRRADAARSGAPGTGLGLAIVDRIVRSHGGRFELLAAKQGAAPRGLRARIGLPTA